MESQNLPEVRSTPCFDCPWRRNAVKGWLGPWSAEEWEQIAHGEAPIACHVTLDGDNGWNSDGVVQCAGAAIYRANVCKDPRDPAVATLPPDKELVFAFGEFVEYHDGITKEEHQERHRKELMI